MDELFWCHLEEQGDYTEKIFHTTKGKYSESGAWRRGMEQHLSCWGISGMWFGGLLFPKLLVVVHTDENIMTKN